MSKRTHKAMFKKLRTELAGDGVIAPSDALGHDVVINTMVELALLDDLGMREKDDTLLVRAIAAVLENLQGLADDGIITIRVNLDAAEACK